MPAAMDANLEMVNFALSCIFVVEMVMKMFGLGLRLYARDRFNLFDAFIVTMGLLETIASPPSFMSKNQPKKGAVSALRSFRLFRVFKLARDWKSLRELLEMIARAVASITNFAVLLFLFIYIYALIGVQFFGNTMRFDVDGYPTPFTLEGFWDGTVPRNNFDTLLWAVVTVFQVITGENWNEIMYDTIRGNGKFACIYFITLVVLGNFVLMNLFLALLLDNFGADDEEQIKEKQEETKKLAAKMSVMKSSGKGKSLKSLRSLRGLRTFRPLPDWEPVVPQNFNNVGMAMLTFFEISTTEGWASVMVAAIDSNGIGMQPIRDNNMNWALFFVAFIMVGSFFVVNLFVGVIIDNFNRMKAALGGDFMLTPEQKKWIEAQKAASRVGPVRIMKPPQHPLRRFLFYAVKAKRFEWFIMICIIVNTFLMAGQYFGESTMQAYVINIVNEFFAAVFTVEAVIKLTAFSWEYFEDQWNQFDFFVVLGTLLSVIVEMFTGASVRSLAMLVRVFRVTRILRLVKASKSIRQILLTLYIALPGLSNITSILFLMLFIYSTMGVQLFAKIALNDNIDSHANFRDFGKAFLLLLRSATGEAWDTCMHDLASSTPGCVDDPPYNPMMCGFNDFDGCIPLNGCGSPIAFAFFCSFTLLVTYVMLNLTIAVILEGFSLSHEDEEPLFDQDLLEEFQVKWADIDPKATGFVKVDMILQLVNTLKPPLGRYGMPFSMSYFFKFMRQLEVPLYEGEYIHFRDVLLAMTREMVKGLTGDVGTITQMPADQDSAGLMSKRRIDFFAHQYFGACRIQRQVAQWLQIKRRLEKKYMEEYKNKIKKPSGRPKKQRDARVFTIG
ncbi:hypothetical protein BBO99_00000965 [Phytophthora kernoviae]|uniref:EF-hand domain-containing protein n=1 Tax=Phytophthora kernoviae TaxID=325452 RepID=A0A3R7K2Y2_9STRA|nr:hypothetical protein JM16_001723 [Phytophthora kernoviae]RLN46485.1 hypothetical protein BBI17_000867 [Phytophthora kernoviae]RLN84854.1 hypothetical protein BBO99_00000965 [Phytophthora kernoviae]